VRPSTSTGGGRQPGVPTAMKSLPPYALLYHGETYSVAFWVVSQASFAPAADPLRASRPGDHWKAVNQLLTVQ